MGYANDGATIYLATFKGTRKVANIERDPNVAIAVSEDYDDWGKIQGVQIQGKATFLENKEEIDRAVSCIVRNFPHFARMDPNPDIVFLKIEPVEGFFIDYTKGFAHKDKVMY
jgi:general stress protein 26